VPKGPNSTFTSFVDAAVDGIAYAWVQRDAQHDNRERGAGIGPGPSNGTFTYGALQIGDVNPIDHTNSEVGVHIARNSVAWFHIHTPDSVQNSGVIRNSDKVNQHFSNFRGGDGDVGTEIFAYLHHTIPAFLGTPNGGVIENDNLTTATAATGNTIVLPAHSFRIHPPYEDR
jgi:hypothetical protein